MADDTIDWEASGIPLTAIDRKLLQMRDEDYESITFDQLRHYISTNQLEELKRRPSDLRKYLIWSTDIKKRYGGITPFVIKERLFWPPLPPLDPLDKSEPPRFSFKNATPFADKDDYQILWNDWPYGLADGITHICVWLKTPIAIDTKNGDVTAESRKLIEDFVDRTFVRGLDEALGEGKGRENVLWFKNWVALQSVRGVDHVHVMVKDAPEELLDRWTAR